MVVLREVSGQGGSRAVHPRGAVGIVVKSPDDRTHSYRVRFTDGMEEPIKPDDLVALAHYKNNVLKGESSDEAKIELQNPLFSRVMSQFKKMQADLRNQGQVKPKHVMHLIRLLISGIHILRHGFVPVRVDAHREQLLAIKRGDIPWEETESWRSRLHSEFDNALAESTLPERPDYERANDFLISARRSALE